ncbi:hypothetical protein V0U79_05670 [Hyphobacterium sp. HN65]|uniref:Uncharacterized protein n=1 Tax=Hyphobacterium lacteum TaxID=3116575 RepID=A0ABU7LPM3_9PROT|nr:hypothetical protein [Hyphobacterium sp. HN65]MEE2525847.1 hypothetical protein [Hyphobacterium sp. HN65]
MYQMHLEFDGDKTAKAFDRQIAKLLEITSQQSADPAFVMITSNNSADKRRRKITTDDPTLFVKLSEMTSD